MSEQELQSVRREIQNDSEKIKIVYWSVGESEKLVHETINAAIKEHLEHYHELSDAPHEIIVVGYSRMQPVLSDNDTLEHTLEYLDEEFGDPDGDRTKPTEKMREAERAYHAVILAEYESWMCEPVVRHVVDLRRWISDWRMSRASRLFDESGTSKD